jgi:hypothetical protein
MNGPEMKYPTTLIIAALFCSTEPAEIFGARVYDAAGIVIETHEHKRFQRVVAAWAIQR